MVCVVVMPVTVQVSNSSTLCMRTTGSSEVGIRIVNSKLFKPGRAAKVH